MPQETIVKPVRPPLLQSRAAKFVCGIIAAIIVVIMLTVLITWLVLQAHKPKYYLEYGSVSELNVYGNDGPVSSKWHFNLTTRNPNKRTAIYYDKIETAVAYDGDELAWGSHVPFYQGHKNITSLQTRLSGDYVYLQGGSARDMKLEHQARHVDLEFRLRAKIRFKVGNWKSGHYSLGVRCRHAKLDVAKGTLPRMKCKVTV